MPFALEQTPTGQPGALDERGSSRSPLPGEAGEPTKIGEAQTSAPGTVSTPQSQTTTESAQPPQPIGPVGVSSTALFVSAVVFLGILLAVLVTAYFRRGEIDSQRWRLLKFFCSLCAGIGAGLMTGALGVGGSIPLAGGTLLSVSAGGGVALFVLVWLTFDGSVGGNGASMSVPEGWTFRRLVEAVAETESTTARFTGFAPTQLDAPLKPVEIRRVNPRQLIEAAREITVSPEVVPKYRVLHEANGPFSLEAIK